MDLLEGDASVAMARLRPFPDTPGWEEHLSFLLLVGSARLEAGDLDLAEEAIAKVVADTTRQRLPIGLVDARRGAREEAETSLRHAVQLAGEIVYPWGQARAVLATSYIRLVPCRVQCVMQRGDSRDGDGPRAAGRGWSARRPGRP